MAKCTLRTFYYDVVGRYEDAWRSWEAVAKTGLGDANYIVEGIRLEGVRLWLTSSGMVLRLNKARDQLQRLVDGTWRQTR